MQNYQDTIISQYATSPILGQLIADVDAWIDPSADFDAFYENIWSIDSAQGVGLDIWGRIVGIDRAVNIPGSQTYLGFTGPPGVSGDSFNQAPFYTSAPLTANFFLSDTAYRTLVLAKALANICSGSITGINAVLMLLFGDEGDAYVNVTGSRTFQFYFNFAPSAVDIGIMQKFTPFLKPAGVTATIAHL